jgi:hypothetical protein
MHSNPTLLPHFAREKKLKYAIEARLPLPSHGVMLCVRAEGTGRSLQCIAFSALDHLLTKKLKMLNDSLYRLIICSDQKRQRKRGANGRYMKEQLSPAMSDETNRFRERLRLINTYEAILYKVRPNPNPSKM